VVFTPWATDELNQIIDLLLAQVRQRLSDQGITLRFSPEVRDLLYARVSTRNMVLAPLRRTIQTMLMIPWLMRTGGRIGFWSGSLPGVTGWKRCSGNPASPTTFLKRI